SNVAKVGYSIINMLNTATIIFVILISPALARKFGKKTISVVGFALSAVCWFLFYFLRPTDIGGMISLTLISAVVYAPPIPLFWAIYPAVADYFKWKPGRRATGIVFATIGFALKSGLALGSSAFLWTMAGAFNYDSQQPPTAETINGFRICVSLIVSGM